MSIVPCRTNLRNTWLKPFFFFMLQEKHSWTLVITKVPIFNSIYCFSIWTLFIYPFFFPSIHPFLHSWIKRINYRLWLLVHICYHLIQIWIWFFLGPLQRDSFYLLIFFIFFFFFWGSPCYCFNSHSCLSVVLLEIWTKLLLAKSIKHFF